MFPNWHDHYNLPTVGDDVIIKHTVTVDSDVGAKSFKVSVQPRTPNSVLTNHGNNLKTLLTSTHVSTANFLDKYLRSNIEQTELDTLKVDLKNILENHRSLLEYTAHYMAERCTPKPSKVYFPVANSKDDVQTFTKKINKWFPKLSNRSPSVIDYLLSIQEFNGETWLRQLADLTNFNKHCSLSDQELNTFHSNVVKCGNVGIRLGELGFRSITLEDKGKLRFINTLGEQVDLNMPCVLDATITSIPYADSRIELIEEKRELYSIKNYDNSIAHTIWNIDKNVFRAINTISSLLSH
ncbi:MAG: hypothetical protein A4E25_00209 [Methanobacterium sp. PtaB.Bin024]|jgi:hypothetical protein|nr:MAG: hypothetical protein A4E25_00209 [Methanobacterium sp. PtaB.Bin024]